MADREPGTAEGRLGTVRPDPRPSPDHAGHDRWLVVRWTTDPADLTPAETAQARALLAACADCAALAADLGAISHATATSVTPARPRDFRLTPGQATASRGGVLDRLRRWFASPGSSAARPLAGAAVAIGLLLVVVAPSIGPTVSTTGDRDAGPQARVMASAMPPATAKALPEADVPAADATMSIFATAPEATQAAKGTMPPGAPDGVGAEVNADAGPTGDPASQAGLMMGPSGSPGPSAAGDTAASDRVAGSPDGGAGEVAPGGADRDPVDGQRQSTTQPASSASDATTFALMLVGIVLAGTGLMVLAFAWFARRWQDPLLR